MCRSGAGLLVPGNPRLGTLRWRGRHYVCSTVDRAEQFGVEPDLYIAAVSLHISHNHGVRLQQLCSGAAAGGAAHRAGAARDGGRGRGHGAGPPAGDQVNIYISTQYLHNIYTEPRATPPARQRRTPWPRPASTLTTAGTSGTSGGRRWRSAG